MKMIHYLADGTKKTAAVSDVLFGAPVNKVLLSQAIYVYRSNERQGTSKVKTRSEVAITKRKVYAQKGTGNARHGSKNAPIFVGGGIAHGPNGMQNWSRDLSKKMKKAAVISALSAQAENTVLHEGLFSVTGKTSEAAKILADVAKNKKVLVLLAERMEAVERSLRNLPKVEIITAQLVTAYDLARAQTIVTNQAGIDALEQRLVTKNKTVGKKVTATAKSMSDVEAKVVKKKPAVKTEKKKVATKK